MKRREFVQFMAAVSSGGTFFGNTVRMMATGDNHVTREMVIEAEKLAGIKFTKAQRDMMIPTLQNYLQNVQYIKEISMPPEFAPRLYFLSDTKGLWTLTSKKVREG
jgi:hypothetical protein